MAAGREKSLALFIVTDKTCVAKKGKMKDVQNSAKNYLFLYLHFRYHGDSSSRSRAYRHKPQLTIALEGRRDFSPEKRESFLAYTPRAIASARPRARVHPTHVDIGLSRQAQTQVTTFDSF